MKKQAYISGTVYLLASQFWGARGEPQMKIEMRNKSKYLVAKGKVYLMGNQQYEIVNRFFCFFAFMLEFEIHMAFLVVYSLDVMRNGKIEFIDII